MIKSKSLAALLLPVYNAGRFLPQCLDTISAQSHTRWYLIAVDDGSTDNSPEILEKFRLAHPGQVTILTAKTNQGLVPTLNAGLKEIKHLRPQYVARIDSDDYLHPQRLQTQITFLDLYSQIDLLGSYVKFIDAENRIIGHKTTYQHHPSIRSAFCFYNPLFHPTLMWRQSWANKVKFQYSSNFPQAEDYDAWTRYAFRTTFANLPRYLYFYRLHGHQISRTKAQIQAEQTAAIKQNFQQQFLGHYYQKPQLQKQLKFIMERDWPKKIKIALLERLAQ